MAVTGENVVPGGGPPRAVARVRVVPEEAPPPPTPSPTHNDEEPVTANDLASTPPRLLASAEEAAVKPVVAASSAVPSRAISASPAQPPLSPRKKPPHLRRHVLGIGERAASGSSRRLLRAVKSVPGAGGAQGPPLRENVVPPHSPLATEGVLCSGVAGEDGGGVSSGGGGDAGVAAAAEGSAVLDFAGSIVDNLKDQDRFVIAH